MNKQAVIDVNIVNENSLLLTWPEIISAEQHQEIMAVKSQIQAIYGEAIIDCIACYNSLMVYYQFQVLNTYQLIAELKSLLQQPRQLKAQKAEQNIIEIPVLYDLESGWDLADVAKQTKLTIAQVIELHSQTTFHAYALGFTPGFCYLASLPAQLQLPRKANPRLSVPAGAVAIAEQQSAVYPSASPGGWHILGQTPLAMFSATKEHFQPLINVGQAIKFVPISKAKFLELGGQVCRVPQ